MNLIRVYAGELLLRAAALCAKTGRQIGGGVPVVHVVEAAANARELEVDVRLPPGIVRGLRIDSADACEIVGVRSVSGRRAVLERPLAKTYPAGSSVRVLI